MIKKVLKKSTAIASYVILAVLVLLVAFVIFCKVSNRVAYIGNYSTMKIISGSMEDVIPVDTYILIEKSDVSDIKVGDVIVFYSKDPTIYGKLNTHRVIAVEETADGRVFTTKGDNNSIKDSYTVAEQDYVGRYVRNLESLSAVANFISNPAVFLLLIAIPAIALFLLSAKDLASTISEAKHKKLVAAEVERLKKNGGLPKQKTEDENVSQTQTETENQVVHEENKGDRE